MPTKELNGVEIRYETAGSGPTVLLLHGLGSAVEDWETQIEVFSDRYRVIAMDFRGHGQSEKPAGPYSLPGFASDAAALLRQLDAAPAHLVGISLGGMVGFELALAEPELVRSLVIVNSRADFLVRTFADRLNVVLRFGLLRLLGLKTLAKLLSRKIFPKPEQEQLRQVAIDRFAANDPVAYRATMEAIVGWSVEDRLGEIGHPVLLVAADGDYTPVADKEAIAAKMVRGRSPHQPAAGRRDLAEVLGIPGRVGAVPAGGLVPGEETVRPGESDHRRTARFTRQGRLCRGAVAAGRGAGPAPARSGPGPVIPRAVA